MTVPTPTISLIVCTRNRAHALRRCLDAIVAADHYAVEVELILVDNGSTDHTPAVVTSTHTPSTLPIKHVREPRLGLSNARNAGLAAATGKILAFTDDDCYLSPDYFSVLRSSYRNNDFAYSGGRILRFDETDAFFACNEQAYTQRFLPGSFIPAGKIQGANMAFRRQVYEKIGGFDPELGAGTRFRCEDVDYIARASDGGFAGRHLPEVVVYHHHGRKPGPELTRLRLDNDYARGAYYAKRLLAGDGRVFLRWIQLTLSRWRRGRLRKELQGFRDFAAAEQRRSRAR